MGTWSNNLHYVLFDFYSDWYDNFINFTGVEPLEELNDEALSFYRLHNCHWLRFVNWLYDANKERNAKYEELVNNLRLCNLDLKKYYIPEGNEYGKDR